VINDFLVVARWIGPEAERFTSPVTNQGCRLLSPYETARDQAKGYRDASSDFQIRYQVSQNLGLIASLGGNLNGFVPVDATQKITAKSTRRVDLTTNLPRKRSDTPYVEVDRTLCGELPVSLWGSIDLSTN